MSTQNNIACRTSFWKYRMSTERDGSSAPKNYNVLDCVLFGSVAMLSDFWRSHCDISAKLGEFVWWPSRTIIWFTTRNTCAGIGFGYDSENPVETVRLNCVLIRVLGELGVGGGIVYSIRFNTNSIFIAEFRVGSFDRHGLIDCKLKLIINVCIIL